MRQILSKWYDPFTFGFLSQNSKVGGFRYDTHKVTIYTVSQKTTLTLHTAHQPILVIFGTDVAEWVRYWMVNCYSTSHNYCLGTTLGNVNPRNWVCSVMFGNDITLACYNFDTHQPILIYFVDSKVVLWCIVCK